MSEEHRFAMGLAFLLMASGGICLLRVMWTLMRRGWQCFCKHPDGSECE
jgi:hypothetical protein